MCTHGQELTRIGTKTADGILKLTHKDTIVQKGIKQEHYCERNRFKRYKIEPESNQKMETLDLEQAERTLW